MLSAVSQSNQVVDVCFKSDKGFVFYREVTTEGTNVIYHRVSLPPGQTIEGLPLEIVDMCNATWTPEIIDAYKNYQG